MFKLIVLALLSTISISQATSFEQTRDCLKGPEFWCKSVQNARYCGAFKHCLDTIWTTHSKYLINDQNDKTCDQCVACLHDSTKQEKCSNIDLNLDEVTDMFMASIPSVTICKLVNGCQVEINKPVELSECQKLHPRTRCDSIDNARKCNSVEYCRENVWSKLKPMILNEKYNTNETPTCGFCVWIFNQLHEALQQNLTQIDIETYLKGACTLLPSADEKKKCTELIDSNFPELYNLVLNSVDPGIICRVIKLCKDEHLVEKPIESKIKIKILNPDDVVVITPLKEEKHKQHLIGSKTELIVAKLSKTGGVSCELCSLILTGAKFMIENHKGEDEVLGFIRSQLCNRLGSLNSTCVEYVNTVGKELLEALMANVEPSVICKQMGLCLAIQVTSPNTKRFFDINVRDSSNCSVCKLVMAKVKSMIQDKKTESDILDYIRADLCDKNQQYAEMCKTVITAYGPVILQLVANEIEPDQICRIIGMCPMNEIKAKVDDNPQCVLCEFVMKTLSSYVNVNSTTAEVEKWLEYVCHVMPSTIKEECKTFVEQYEPIIAALIANQISPDKICQFIGLCPQAVNNLKPVEIQKPVADNAQCALCEFIMKTLDSFIAQNSSSAEVEKWLEYVCEAMPSTVRDECKAFVTEYEPIIAALLSNQISLDKVCQFVKVCPKSDDFSVELSKEMDEKINSIQISKLKKNGPQCVICEFVMSALSNYITANSSTAEVEKWLDYVCNNVMPSTIKQECTSFVNEYGPVIIQFLASEINPSKICTQIKVCSSSRVSPTYCEACEFTLAFLEYELNKEKTKEATAKAISNVCKIAPKEYEDNCNSIVQTYGVYLIDLLESAEPLGVCQAIKLCSYKAETQKTVNFVSLAPSIENKKADRTKVNIVSGETSDFECTLCVFVAQTVEGLIKQNKSEDEIKDLVEKICNYFPGTLKDQCLSFVDEYIVYVVELLVDDLDPNQACQKLKLCPALSTKVDFRSLIKQYRKQNVNKSN